MIYKEPMAYGLNTPTKRSDAQSLIKLKELVGGYESGLLKKGVSPYSNNFRVELVGIQIGL